jgi:hypothetical protein
MERKKELRPFPQGEGEKRPQPSPQGDGEKELQPFPRIERGKELQPFLQMERELAAAFLKGKGAIQASSLPSGRETE